MLGGHPGPKICWGWWGAKEGGVRGRYEKEVCEGGGVKTTRRKMWIEEDFEKTLVFLTADDIMDKSAVIDGSVWGFKSEEYED
jgi:hypothetical protein